MEEFRCVRPLCLTQTLFDVVLSHPCSLLCKGEITTIRLHRVYAIVLALALCFGLAGFASAAVETQEAEQVKLTETLAASNVGDDWFGNQLQGSEAVFYNALCALRDSGDLYTGVASIDLMRGVFAGDKLTSGMLRAYLEGDRSLAKAFQAGRDAFAYDNADLFYVDFSKMSFRVSRTSGVYSAKLGAKAGGNYYKDGFSSPYEAAVAVSASRNVISQIAALSDRERSDKERARAAHDALLARVSYGNGFCSNEAYGALMQGTAVCEGYARAYKAILEELDIPCVLIRGKTSGGQLHMWCAVRIGGEWLAVDPAWDDPGSGMRYTYFLQRSGTLSQSHIPVGVLSPGGRAFRYPNLAS